KSLLLQPCPLAISSTIRTASTVAPGRSPQRRCSVQQRRSYVAPVRRRQPDRQELELNPSRIAPTTPPTASATSTAPPTAPATPGPRPPPPPPLLPPPSRAPRPRHPPSRARSRRSGPPPPPHRRPSPVAPRRCRRRSRPCPGR